MDLSVVLPEVSKSVSEQFCGQCSSNKRSKRRDFSFAAWASLSAWHEVVNTDRNCPMCDSCYQDLRAILIERSDELSDGTAHSQSFSDKVASQVA